MYIILDIHIVKWYINSKYSTVNKYYSHFFNFSSNILIYSIFMQDITRSELPPDYFYYRTISSDYLSYLHGCSKNVRVIQVGKYGQFAWAKKILGLWIIKSEKIDTPITIEQIRASGIV